MWRPIRVTSSGAGYRIDERVETLDEGDGRREGIEILGRSQGERAGTCGRARRDHRYSALLEPRHELGNAAERLIALAEDEHGKIGPGERQRTMHQLGSTERLRMQAGRLLELQGSLLR